MALVSLDPVILMTSRIPWGRHPPSAPWGSPSLPIPSPARSHRKHGSAISREPPSLSIWVWGAPGLPGLQGCLSRVRRDALGSTVCSWRPRAGKAGLWLIHISRELLCGLKELESCLREEPKPPPQITPCFCCFESSSTLPRRDLK